MVPESLQELTAVSEELASLFGKSPATPQPVPANSPLHPDLASVLATGAFVLQREGVALDKIDEFTQKARSRGMRNNVVIFGWHPRGHTWWAAPATRGKAPKVLELDRLNRLATTALTLEEFVQKCVARAQQALEEAKAPKPEPKEEPQAEAAPTEAKPKPKRIAKVVLPDSLGGTIIAGDRSEAFGPEELGYLFWCIEGLQLLEPTEAPDLSRWEPRCLRALRLDAVPSESDAIWPEWLERWHHLTRRDRAATASVSHLIPSHKLTARGLWTLAPTELAILRRNTRAKPPRHVPSTEQAAIWARFTDLLDAEVVEISI